MIPPSPPPLPPTPTPPPPPFSSSSSYSSSSTSFLLLLFLLLLPSCLVGQLHSLLDMIVRRKTGSLRGLMKCAFGHLLLLGPLHHGLHLQLLPHLLDIGHWTGDFGGYWDVGRAGGCMCLTSSW